MRDMRCGTPSPSLLGRTAEHRRNPTLHSPPASHPCAKTGVRRCIFTPSIFDGRRC
jgi:hypothetical protein